MRSDRIRGSWLSCCWVLSRRFVESWFLAGFVLRYKNSVGGWSGRINLKHLGGVLTPAGHRRDAARFKFCWSKISDLKHLTGVLTP
jgi:hypothetical protein